jgi:hypothetical protein
MMEPNDQATIGIPAVMLLRGILYREKTQAWDLLLRYRGRLETYFEVLGVILIVDEAEGYAYLRQKPVTAETAEDEAFPRLMSRRRLSYPLTLLLVLLRKRLLEFETLGNETRLILSERDMIEMMRIYWSEVETNERKREDQLILHIKKLATYGFLKALKAEKGRYEVNNILKAYVPIEELKTILEKLKNYAQERNLINNDNSED